MNVVLKASSENLYNIQVFPTPESPIKSNLKSKSYCFLAIFPKQTSRKQFKNHFIA